MSDDLVKRLRYQADTARNNYPEVFRVSEDIAYEAADRIEKLGAENKKLKNAMLGIIDLCRYGAQRTPSWCSEPEGYCACVKAFDAMDYDLSNMSTID